MGQIFYACAYDIENKTCCTMYADKFPANCYSCSAAVLSMHYLLRQAPYRIMWGGDDIIEDIPDISSEEDLFGLSTYLDHDYFDLNTGGHEKESYYDKAMFIDEKHKIWKRINVCDESVEYFDWGNTHSVDYSGYLVNHTKRLAVDLAAYYEKSALLFDDGGEAAIDPVPVLTETGGGTQMAFLKGISTDTTEDLAGEWCGDLLQIVDILPDDYKLIDCCFADVKKKSFHCYMKYGVNKDGLLISDKNGSLFSAAQLNLFGKRGIPCHVKVEKVKHNIKFKTVPVT